MVDCIRTTLEIAVGWEYPTIVTNLAKLYLLTNTIFWWIASTLQLQIPVGWEYPTILIIQYKEYKDTYAKNMDA
jgi:hypothetical protein